MNNALSYRAAFACTHSGTSHLEESLDLRFESPDGTRSGLSGQTCKTSTTDASLETPPFSERGPYVAVVLDAPQNVETTLIVYEVKEPEL